MNIIKKYALTFTLLLAFVGVAMAQSTTNSPYSKFGVGNLNGAYLPQNRGMGNLAYGISSYGGYNNLNISNPASYSKLRLTVFEVGARVNAQTLTKGSVSDRSFNASLNHLAFGIPVTKKSALSFGILPYSNLGYEFVNTAKVDTFNVNQVYSGEGGLTKAYLGYGIGIGKHFNVGVNMSYIFGDLKQSRAAEYTLYPGFLNSKTEDNNAVGGLNFDFGAQYITALDQKTKLTVGYTGGVKTQLNTKFTQLTSRYRLNQGSEVRTDSIAFRNEVSGNLTLPTNNNFGFSIEKMNKWLIGADFRTAQWSEYAINNQNQGLNNTWGFSAGGQITPDVNAVTNYFQLIDYRLGINYDKSYVTTKNTNIDAKSINIGFGFPLVSSRTSFYKINFTTEIGKRGTLDNGLIKENFYNFYLGFTINDRWFQKYKYD